MSTETDRPAGVALVLGFLARGAGYGALGGSVLGAGYATGLVAFAGSADLTVLGAAATFGLFYGGPAGIALGTVGAGLLAAMCAGASSAGPTDAHRFRRDMAIAVALAVVGLGFGSVLWWHPPTEAIPWFTIGPTVIAAVYGAWAALQVTDWYLLETAPVRNGTALRGVTGRG